MVSVTWQGLTVDATQSKWLHVATMALRFHDASNLELADANDRSWLEWKPTCSFLTDKTLEITVDETDWQWFHTRGYELFALSHMPFESGREYAQSLTSRLDATHAGAAALVFATAAHVARLDARAWSLALLQSYPSDWHATIQWGPSLDPLLGWLSRWAAPDLLPGITGPGVALGLADCARAGLWRQPFATAPDGRIIELPEQVWDLLEQNHWDRVFDTGPEF